MKEDLHDDQIDDEIKNDHEPDDNEDDDGDEEIPEDSDLMQQAELLNGLSANKFSQVLTNLCNMSNNKKYSKFVKNAKVQKENNNGEFEVMNGF